MKKQLLIIALCLMTAAGCFAQSKKEMAATIQSLNDKCANLETQVQQQQMLILNMQNSLLTATNDIKSLQDSIAKVRKDFKLATPPEPKEIPIEERLKGKNDNETTINTLAYNFFVAKTWQEKYEYVMQSPEVKKEMEDYDYSDWILKEGSWFYDPPKYLDTNLSELNAVIHILYSYKLFFVVNTKDGYKIDWEATVGYNGTNKDYIGNKKDPSPFEWRTSFNSYDIKFSSTYNRWELHHFTTITVSVANELVEDTKDGKQYYYIFKEHFDTKSGEFVIDKIVNKSWSKYEKKPFARFQK